MEERKLLTSFADAPLFTGTDLSDDVEVRYVDEHTVDIQINGTLHEGVDTTNGIRIDLGNESARTGNPSDPAPLSNGDIITIDQRVKERVSISDAEGIAVSGDEGNLVQTSYLVVESPNAVSSPEGDMTMLVNGSPLSSLPDDLDIVFADPEADLMKVRGSINGNITFIGANVIQTGGGNDVFNLSNNGKTQAARLSNSLVVKAGAGDDLIRFGGQQPRVTDTMVFDASGDPDYSSIRAEGESGNDRFVYRDLGRGVVHGGDGFDIVDRRQSTDLQGDGRLRVLFDPADADPVQNTRVSFNAGIERYMVSADNNTSATLFDGDGSQRFEWNVDGAVTTVTEMTSGTAIELLNYNRFVGSSGSVDSFFISATAEDLHVFNADFVQISSTRVARQGNLDGIQHEISFANRGLYVGGFLGTIAETDGIDSPTVYISDATGNGLNATLTQGQTISGVGGGLVRFSGDVKELTVFGSTEANDSVTVRETWAPTTIYTRGGDDVFMVGSTNKDANGDLMKLQAPLTIGAGAGTDRIYINNQDDTRANQIYSVTGRRVVVTGDGTQRQNAPQINFNSSMTVARINGSVLQQNRFSVTPASVTRFVVDGRGSSGSSSQLSVATNEEVSIYRSPDDNKTGSVQTSGLAPVHFYGMEDVERVPLFVIF